MKKVDRGEVLGLADYEVIRERFRDRIIAEKKLRRVALGPRASAMFENHDTVLLQIQEMLRTERITREAAVLHEMETYNALVPGDGELSATLFLEIEEKDERERFLRDARGIERTIALVVGGARSPASWEPSRELEDRASAVLYVKFALPPAAIEALRTRDAPVELVVEHAAYAARITLPALTVASLAEDLVA